MVTEEDPGAEGAPSLGGALRPFFAAKAVHGHESRIVGARPLSPRLRA